MDHIGPAFEKTFLANEETSVFASMANICEYRRTLAVLKLRTFQSELGTFYSLFTALFDVTDSHRNAAGSATILYLV